MDFTINEHANRMMNEALDEFEGQVRSAERDFESDGRILEIKSSYSISDLSQLADIVAESKRITDELYASYEAIVRAANSICKPLADQGVAPETLTRMVDMLKHINSECSTLGTNFSASVDSYSLGGIASTRYSPSAEARMIETNWRLLHDMHPLVAEEKARREEAARIEREKREEAQRIEREKAIAEYPERLAAWEQKRAETAALQEKLMNEARETERKRLVENMEEKRRKALAKAQEKASEGGRLKREASERIKTLSFFKFSEKMKANEQVLLGAQMIAQANELAKQANDEYEEDRRRFEANFERALELKRKEIERQHPLPTKPRDPNDPNAFNMTPTRIANEGIKKAIYDTLLVIGPATVSDVMAACPEAGEISNQRVSALLRQLVVDGSVERNDIKCKAYFTAVE